MKKIYLIIFFFLSYFILGLSSSFAVEDFQTSYKIKYQLTQNAKVVVNQEVDLTNNLSNVYATEYLITIGATNLQNIKARDGEGDIKPLITKTNNSTQIKLSFNQKVVGKGNTLHFNLQYTTQDFASRNGKVTEITIPQIDHREKLDSYQAELIIPNQLGQPAFLTPQPDKSFKQENQTVYLFKNKSSTPGISGAFGGPQIFDFELQYQLNNPENIPYKTEIALPPDTPYQKVFYNQISPPPDTIKIDKDGNWLGVYKLKGNENKQVIAKGSAEIYIQPQNTIQESEGSLDQYLQADKYWEVKDPQIQQLADELKTPEKIYKYLVENFIYDYGRVTNNLQRLGAKKALNNKNSVICMEFTDLFIAISRAAGIPARELNGYAFTNNSKLRPLSLEQDILHAWPEYYNQQKKQWIPIDPTWGNTTGGVDFFNKLDYNHFTFVIHGTDSEFPLPAGAYRKGDKGKKINIKFGDTVKEKKDLSLKLDFPEKIISGLPIKGKIIITNQGNTALKNKELSYFSDELEFKKNKIKIPYLPPYGQFTHTVKINKTSFFDSGTKNIHAIAGTNKQVQQIKLTSPFMPKILPWIGLCLGVTFLFVILKMVLKKQ